jgi:hypothetical protein
VYRVLFEASIPRRFFLMSLEHEHEIDTLIDRIISERDHRVPHSVYCDNIRQQIISFANIHRQLLMDASTVIEMAIWREKICELREKEADHFTIRTESRVNSGEVCEKVIPLVLAFL